MVLSWRRIAFCLAACVLECRGAANHSAPLRELALPFDCDAGDLEDWSYAHQNWCCHHSGKGCSQVQERASIKKMVCGAGIGNFRAGWSLAKKSWCCIHEGVACPPKHVYEPFDCELDDPSIWPPLKRQYCCCKHRKGCGSNFAFNCDDVWVLITSTTTTTTLRPRFNCAIGVVPFWSAEKKSWCCTREGRGCPTTTLTTTSITTTSRTTSTLTTTTRTTVSTTTTSVTTTHGKIGYDCQSGCPEHWSIDKQAYCCQKEHIGCVTTVTTTALVDCMSGYEHTETWPESKREQCCKMVGIGCTTTTVATTAVSQSRWPDCVEGLHCADTCWSRDKQAWCCQVKNLGCPKTTTPPHPCLDTKDIDKWPERRKQFCCENYETGCPESGENETNATENKSTTGGAENKSTTGFPGTLVPFDCLSGLGNCEKGWSGAKKKWCCKHQNFCCEEQKATTTTLTFDCEAGFANWWTGWSPEKKKWCCIHEHKGCPTTEPGQPGPSPSPEAAPGASPSPSPEAAPSPESTPGPSPEQAPGGAAAPGPSPEQAPGGAAAPGPSPEQAPGGAAAPGPSPEQAPGGAAAPGPSPEQAPGGAAAPGPSPGGYKTGPDAGIQTIPEKWPSTTTFKPGPVPAPPVPAPPAGGDDNPTNKEPFNCLAGLENAQSGWSDRKKVYCCDKYKLMCPTTTTPTSSQPYDCAAGFTNFRTAWSAGKKKWCCDYAGIGCLVNPEGSTTEKPAKDYDCVAGVKQWESGWSVSKKKWCCEHKQIGCQTSEPYDCTAGAGNAAAGWSDNKKRWCCQSKGINCAHQTTALPYNCMAGLAKWMTGWSDAKKTWCCAHEHKGCPLPFNCQAGVGNWKVGWSNPKKEWCCKNMHLGCPTVAPPETPGQYDCQAGINNWVSGWSIPKKHWCCAHERIACPTLPPGPSYNPTVAPPFDCMAGLPTWKQGWSPAKKRWCCTHEGKGCEGIYSNTCQDCVRGTTPAPGRQAGDWWRKVWPFQEKEARRLQAEKDCPCSVSEEDLRVYGAKFAEDVQDSPPRQLGQPATGRRVTEDEPPSRIKASLSAHSATFIAGMATLVGLAAFSFRQRHGAWRTVRGERPASYTELIAKEQSLDVGQSAEADSGATAVTSDE